jgi:AcrR family transcriptional regulator
MFVRDLPGAPLADQPSTQPTSAATRERILDAGEALFAERGFAATTVRDIVGRVGLTAASLYNHFEGKEALYTAVLERGIRPLVDVMEALGTREPTRDATDEMIGAVMDHLRRHPHLPRLIHHEAVAGGAHLARLARDWVVPMLARGLTEMKRSPDSPWEDDEQPLVIAAWIHLILGHFTMAPLFAEVLDEDPLAPPMLERQTRFLRKLARLIERNDAD